MKRRHFIKSAIAGGILAGLGSGGLLWLRDSGKNIDVSIDSAIALLNELSNNPVRSTGAWSPYKVFVHCAQSIEYSMSAFPEHKSALFKNTAGQVAYSIFSTANSMRHSLSEPIPGAPDIADDGDIRIAFNRLIRALQDFKVFAGTPGDHFAYGELSKEEYATAHVIHLYNHMTELTWD